jgi:predicted Zn-ribbon and HTH transcriptional regulator
MTVNEILRNNIDKYRENNYLSYHQEKIVKKIINCRTEKMGIRVLRCNECGYEENTYCSCRNRHCPLCQTYEKEKWIEKRKCDLINTQYFHVVFTIPDEIKMLVKANKVILYDLMFKSVRETLLTLGEDPEHLGAKIGAILILHTWDQKLRYHPHIHCLIPGGGLNKNNEWIYCKEDYFISVKLLSRMFMYKFLDYLEKLYTKLYFPKTLRYLKSFSKFYDFKTIMYSKSWYSYSKETFTGPKAVIEYLGRYTHKIGLTNNRILKVTKDTVTFSYIENKDKNSNGKGKKKQLILSINEFIRRFLLHILPNRYYKIRYIGILGNRNKNTKLKLCQKLTNFVKYTSKSIEELLLKITKGKIFICPKCKNKTLYLAKIDNSRLYYKQE